MNLKFLVISLAIIALLVPESDAFWSRRRRRRRRRRPKPPPGPSQHCRNQVNLYSVIRGNNLHQLARVWAPAVKLAQGETWKPSSVDFFLRHVNVVGGPNPQPLRPNNLPTCNRNCYLKSKGRLNCASCTNLPFLHGEHPSKKGHKKLKLEGCTHGVAYAALGSHGFWPNVGNHVYKNLPNGEKLVDKCSHGEAWNTWNTLKIVDQKPRGQYTGDFKFLNFNGRWGNRERGCGLAKKVLNVCILEHGPQRS
ncbi:hypothetical protein AC249_AIPGENE28935 [Exaiptasia diaphana]|nr:hypothetical protein AC249_AIPGENE28935 [Exaiptasia diaphana]